MQSIEVNGQLGAARCQHLGRESCSKFGFAAESEVRMKQAASEIATIRIIAGGHHWHWLGPSSGRDEDIREVRAPEGDGGNLLRRNVNATFHSSARIVSDDAAPGPLGRPKKDRRLNG